MGRGKKSKLMRTSEKLAKVLAEISKKNNMKNTEAGELLADFYVTNKKRKRIIENIRREIKF